MNYEKDKTELDFAYKIRHALNQSAENLPDQTLNKLAAARKQALARKKPEGSKVRARQQVLAGNTGFSFPGPSTWLGKLGVALPLLVLVLGLFGIYQYEQQRRIRDLADIDTAVLVDELPPAAYLDKGFNAYLNDAQGE
jgi:hypothetical protein